MKMKIQLTKSNITKAILATLLFCSFAAVFAIVLLSTLNVITLDIATNIAILSLSCLSFLIFILISIVDKVDSKNKMDKINKSINFYVEKLVSKMSVGVIILQPDGQIIWTSDFIEERFGKNFSSQSIKSLIPEFNLEMKQMDFEKIISKNEFFYKVNYLANELILTVQDVTKEQKATYFYEIERPVIGEIDIDNFQQYQSLFSEEEIFLIQSTVINLLENLSKKYNFSFKQYVNGKFLIISNRDNLDKLSSKSFVEFEEISKREIIKDVRLSLSIGFGADSSNFNKLMEMAKEGLQQSQSRGGDQITIISDVERPKHFGSKSEIAVLKSRTKIKNVSENLKQKLQDPTIENVLIYGHQMADLDAIGAAYPIYEIAKSYGKEAHIQNQTFDNTTTKAIQKYGLNSKIFISASKAINLTTKNTLVIIVDCADEYRVENIKVFQKCQGQNLFIFDHHRVSKFNEVVNELNTYAETSASSTCEIITEMIHFNQFASRISRTAAQFLLNGIYLDTSQFKKSVSSRTFAAASLLEEWGAKVDEATSILKMSQSTSEIVLKILKNLKEVKPGYWLTSYNDLAEPDVVSIAADEILRIDGRKAAFVIAKQPKKNASDNDVFKLSARSIGVNVQLIAEAVGGGGHFNASAAISDSKNKETIETFTENVIQAIISTKEE